MEVKSILKRCHATASALQPCELPKDSDALAPPALLRASSESAPPALPPLGEQDVDLDELVAAAELLSVRADGPWQSAAASVIMQLAVLLADMAAQASGEVDEDESDTEEPADAEDATFSADA